MTQTLEGLVDRMAHQLRNPLQAILVNLEVLRLRTSRADPQLWATLEDFAAGIEDGVHKLDRRLQLLVGVARAEGEQPASVVPAALLRDLIGAAGLEDGPVRLRLLEDDAEPRRVRIRIGRFTELLFRLLILALSRARGDVAVVLRQGTAEGAEEALEVVLELEPASNVEDPPEGWADLDRLAVEAGFRIRREAAPRGPAGRSPGDGVGEGPEGVQGPGIPEDPGAAGDGGVPTEPRGVERLVLTVLPPATDGA